MIMRDWNDAIPDWYPAGEEHTTAYRVHWWVSHDLKYLISNDTHHSSFFAWRIVKSENIKEKEVAERNMPIGQYVKSFVEAEKICKEDRSSR